MTDEYLKTQEEDEEEEKKDEEVVEEEEEDFVRFDAGSLMNAGRSEHILQNIDSEYIHDGLMILMRCKCFLKDNMTCVCVLVNLGGYTTYVVSLI